MRRARCPLPIAVSFLLCATAAAGAPATTEAKPAIVRAARVDPGVREHDGLFIHLGTGLSAFNGRLASGEEPIAVLPYFEAAAEGGDQPEIGRYRGLIPGGGEVCH